MPAYVYELCLEHALGDTSSKTGFARHYTGKARDVDARLEQQLRGGPDAAKLLQAAVAQNIIVHVAAVWEVDTDADASDLEIILKQRSHAASRCPRCQAIAAGQAVPVEPLRRVVADVQALSRKPISQIRNAWFERRRRLQRSKLLRDPGAMVTPLEAFLYPLPVRRMTGAEWEAYLAQQRERFGPLVFVAAHDCSGEDWFIPY